MVEEYPALVGHNYFTRDRNPSTKHYFYYVEEMKKTELSRRDVCFSSNQILRSVTNCGENMTAFPPPCKWRANVKRSPRPPEVKSTMNSGKEDSRWLLKASVLECEQGVFYACALVTSQLTRNTMLTCSNFKHSVSLILKHFFRFFATHLLDNFIGIERLSGTIFFREELEFHAAGREIGIKKTKNNRVKCTVRHSRLASCTVVVMFSLLHPYRAHFE